MTREFILVTCEFVFGLGAGFAFGALAMWHDRPTAP